MKVMFTSNWKKAPQPAGRDKAGALALHISGTFPDLNLQLWAIRG